MLQNKWKELIEIKQYTMHLAGIYSDNQTPQHLTNRKSHNLAKTI